MTTASTLAWVAAAVKARTPRQVCTANPEFVMTAQRDAEFRRVLNEADVVLADGVGLLWAARRQGQLLPERVAGSDLIYQLAALAAQHGWRVFYRRGRGRGSRDRRPAPGTYPGWYCRDIRGSPRAADEAEIVARGAGSAA
jgi:N-acetylglucosaminyldiphosphoundecaprenol N-acetyl-beta-D-mannosaminyltransferase